MTRKMKIQKPDVEYFGYTQLFRYATWSELTATWFGFIMGVVTSFGLPLSLIIYGEYTQLMVERSIPGGEVSKTVIMKFFGAGKYIKNSTAEENADLLAADAKAFGLAALVIAGVQFLAGVFSIQSLNWSAQRQISRIRLLFLKSVLRQDMSWYDTQPNLNFASKITDDLNKLKEGIGEKIGMFCYLMFSFILSMLMSFTYGWKLTMVVIVSAPLIIISAALLGKAQSSLTVKELNSYCCAGAAAEEALSAIRTVVAFGGEEKEIQRYRERLEPANKAAIHRGSVTGLGSGVMWLIMYWTFALVFWYGVQLIQNDKVLPLDDRTYTPGVLVIVLWGIIGGAQNLGICTPHVEAFAAARGAAQSLFHLIGRVPAIDSLSEDGERPEKVQGDIKLTDVTFRYPSRPDVKVLTGLTIEIKAGETVALLGASGCGKSTILQLVQRLYDPLSGKIELDGRNVSSLNVAWLRSQLGVVGQEPVLFSGTIRDNIAQGKPECSDTEIKEAATAANCHEFIRKLPFGYKTIIGERGTQLSGGQKQRIAIARSLIRNPKILLLDEATSALDARGERRVQDALEKASVGRTTLIVTHRLLTIRGASRIVFIDEGRVVEQGTHTELMALKGNYHKLVHADSCDDNQSRQTKNRTEEGFDVITEDSETNGAAVMGNGSRETTLQQVKQMSRESLLSAQRRFSVSSVASFGRTHGIQSFYETQDVNSDNAENEELKTSVSNWDLLKLNKPEWIYIVFGTISALIVGGVLPIFALLFSGIYGLLSLTDADEISSGTELYCLLFFVIGIVCGAGSFLQSYLFTQAGVKLTQRLRVSTFANFLKQEIGWFDDQKNSVGALCTRLSGDAAAVQGATGVRVGTIFQGASTLLIGVIMALLYSWKMTLVSLITIPIVLGGMYLESLVTQTSQFQERKALEGASKIATEAIMNIRTVHSMGSELLFLKRYEQELKEASKAGGARSRFRGTVYSIGICSPTFGYGLSLFYGGLLIAYEGLPYRNALLVTEALLFGSWMLGQILAFAPNFNGAKVSGARIVNLLNRQSLIKSNEKITDNLSWTADGTVKYSEVDFRYPTRQNVEVLRGLDFEILRGKTVALVGHSGCGKSTAVQLLQRLYEPSRGTVSLDSKNVSTDLKIPRLRCQLGLVSQEPTLFDRTIAENIAYGDNTREVPIEEIIQAAIKSNIHEFISGLPLGYETPLGTNGAQLSGGQKQRVAIARALVRNPRVLLLDEATSALDSQSEKLVQQALDAAKEGRTCITIAHRLSTIQNSDLICVIDKGRVMERGSHNELMAMKGVYADLQSMQGTATDAVSNRQNTSL